MADDRTLRQFLKTLVSGGVTHLPHVDLPEPTPSARRGGKVRQAAQSDTRVASVRQRPTNERGNAPESLPEVTALLETIPETTEGKAACLHHLSQTVAKCQRCAELAESRRQTVFGVGNPNASIMFIGEAPGADEDREGEPFVGAAGQLLNKIIAACDWKREELYICNILRCRPPGNRNPQPQEAKNCREFLDAQIRIVQPDYIVCWGTVAAQHLLDETQPVGRLRGQMIAHGDALVLCTYHPSYLLRHAPAKKQVWEDMQYFKSEIAKREES